MTALALVDTNVLCYRYDARFPRKRERADEILRAGLRDGTLRIPHQAIVELVAALSRPTRGGGAPILPIADARREAEELLGQFEILYPTEAIVRMALRGAAAYQLGWFDAHLWAYAECGGVELLLSEDFTHGRMIGSVEIRDPFRE